MLDSQEKIENANKRYLDSDKGKAAVEKYLNSEKGKEARKKYFGSEAGKAAQLKYQLSEKGQAQKDRVQFFNHLITNYNKWLKSNPEGSLEQFLVENSNGDGENNGN